MYIQMVLHLLLPVLYFRLLYQEAQTSKPGRWSTRTGNWIPVETVFLIPGKPVKREEELKQNAA